jgi:hypothetical protein
VARRDTDTDQKKNISGLLSTCSQEVGRRDWEFSTPFTLNSSPAVLTIRDVCPAAVGDGVLPANTNGGRPSIGTPSDLVVSFRDSAHCPAGGCTSWRRRPRHRGSARRTIPAPGSRTSRDRRRQRARPIAFTR